MLSRLFTSWHRPFVPRRDKLESIAIDLSSSRLTFGFPPNVCQADLRDSSHEPLRRINILDNSKYSVDSDCEDWECERLALQTLVERSWVLPGYTWCDSPINTIAYVLTLYRHVTMSKDMGCFNLQCLKAVIMRPVLLGNRCSPEHNQKAPVYLHIQLTIKQ